MGSSPGGPVGLGRGLAAILVLLAGGMAGGARAGWTDSQTVGPLVCRADFPLAGLDPLLASLAGIEAELARLLGIPPAKRPIEVYLFHDRASYADYLSRYLPGVPYRRALYVKGRGPGRVFAYWSPSVEVDLRHECTHAMLHAALRLVPLWLDEGLAQYFELPPKQRQGRVARGEGRGAEPTGDGRRTTGQPPATSHWPLIADAGRRGHGDAQSGADPPLPDLATLETRTDLAQMGQAEYAGCRAWVHFLLSGPPPARDELIAYLADLREGRQPGLLSQRLRRIARESASHGLNTD
ncbi:MAG: hypothetical protein ABSF26_11855 [Thermoguttaceae bacterium]